MHEGAPVTLVVGSGPTGFAAINALVALGHRPIVLDGGVTLDPERQQLVDHLAADSSAALSEADRAMLTGTHDVDRQVPRHLAFGSDYAYGDGDSRAPIETGFAGAPVPSLAIGGLSNVWTGAMLPVAETDLASWPIGSADLAPHYRQLLHQIPLAGGHDPLEAHFPLHGADVGRLPIPSAAATILSRLGRRARHESESGVVAGRARLAVIPAGDNASGRGVEDRGHLGLVSGSTWSATPAIGRWAADRAVDHRPGHVVRRIVERDDRVEVHADGPTGPVKIEADRVFLAAGAIASTRIVLESLEMWDRPVRLATNQGFGMPLLLPPGMVVADPPTSLPSLFLEFNMADSPHWIHAQVGPLNDLARTELARRLARLPGGDALGGFVARRSLAALCSLHSSEAGHHLLTLSERSGHTPVLHLRTVGNNRFPARARVAARRLRWALALAGVATLAPRGPLVDPRPVSWHVGGSLPMRRRRRSPLDTDVLGRPSAWRRTHVVDSSVLPDVPATTVTFPAMANAGRIVTWVMTDRPEVRANG